MDKKDKEFQEYWNDLSEEVKANFKNMGVKCREDFIKANWKRYENMSIKNRKFFFGDLIKSILNSKNVEEKGIAIEEWKVLYGSFLQSKEWKNFRLKFLAKNPKCNKCPKSSKVPHHKLKTIKTFLEFGFLKPLENFNNFEPPCIECHLKEEGVI